MSRLKRAIRFIHASYLLVKDDPLFLKVMVRFGLGGLILLFVWFIPLAVVIGLIGLTSVGLILIGLIMLLALFSLIIWGRITMIQVIPIFDGTINSDDDAVQEPPQQLSLTAPQIRDAALFAFSLPGLNFGNIVKEIFASPKQEEDQWMGAAYLIWPLMAIESLSLDQAVSKLQQIKRENLIRFQPGLIPVKKLTGILQWILILLGVWIGFVVGMNTADPLTTTGIVPFLGALIGLLLGGVFAIMGVHLNTFSQACYYTAIYRWVKNVETAVLTGLPENSAPPLILGQVLGRISKSKKER